MPNASIHRVDGPVLRVLAGGLGTGRPGAAPARSNELAERDGPSRGPGAVPGKAGRHCSGKVARGLALAAAFTVTASLAFGLRDAEVPDPASPSLGPVAGQSSDPRQDADVVRFLDGSAARLQGEGTTLTLHGVTRERIAVELDHGHGTFRVAPLPDREFSITAGSVTLEVSSGEVEIGLDGSRTKVAVSRGLARISWPNATATLGAGTHGTFPP